MMARFFKFVSSILLIGIVATVLTACNTLPWSKKETENANPLAKIVEIELGDKGNCSIYWNDQNGSKTVELLPEATRFLFKTKKNEIYREVTFSMTAKFSEGDELTHLIVVFQKGHKLTHDEKSIIEKLGIDYMFEIN